MSDAPPLPSDAPPTRARSRSFAIPSKKKEDMIVEEKWKQAYTELEEAVTQKDDQIAAVAELGKTLLEKNQEAERTIYNLKLQDEEKDLVIQELTEKLRLLEARQGNNKPDPEQSQGYLEIEFKTLKARYDSLQSVLEDLQAEYDRLLADSKRKEKQYSQELQEQKQANAELNEQLEIHKQSVKKLTTKEQESKKHTTGLEEDRNRAEDSLHQAEERMLAMQKQLEEIHQRSKHKDRELQELKDQIEEFYEQANELKKTHKKMEETVTQLVMTNHNLHQEKQELQDHLAHARANIEALRNGEEIDPSADYKTGGGMGNSLMSELEQSLENRLKGVPESPRPVSSPVSRINTPGGTPRGAGDEFMSEHEYFYLAAAAVKIGLVMKFPEKSADIFQIDVKAMFEQAVKEHIPFHEWHSWITVQFGHQMYNTVTNRNNKEAEERRKQNVNSSPLPAQPMSPRDNKPSSSPFPWQRDDDEKSFQELELKAKEFKIDKEVAKDHVNWEDLEGKSAVEPVKSSSPFPQQNLQLHRMFECIPGEFVVDFYLCTLDEIKGHMYITQYAIYFHAVKPKSNKELKICWPFNDILSIRKPGKLQLFNTHVIYLKTKRETKFTFGGFPNDGHMDHAYEIMKKLWQTYIDETSKAIEMDPFRANNASQQQPPPVQSTEQQQQTN